MAAQQQKIYSIEFLTWKQNMESNDFWGSIVIFQLLFQSIFLYFLNYDSIVIILKDLCIFRLDTHLIIRIKTRIRKFTLSKPTTHQLFYIKSVVKNLHFRALQSCIVAKWKFMFAKICVPGHGWHKGAEILQSCISICKVWYYCIIDLESYRWVF